MNDNVKTHVLTLLESSQERKRKIALLHYELDHSPQTSGKEMIEAMALGHGEGGGHTVGHISDKTFYIALNYQSRADELNTGLKNEIVEQLVELEQEQCRLEYYISLLEKRQALVVRLAYFEQMPWGEVARQVGVATRTVHKIKNQALDHLVEMYQFMTALPNLTRGHILGTQK